MDDPAQTKPPAAEYRKTPVLPDAELGFLNRNVHIGFIQPLDKLEFVRMRAAQYLPPGGNVINLSIDHRAVGGDAHIAPRGMVSFWYHTAANS